MRDAAWQVIPADAADPWTRVEEWLGFRPGTYPECWPAFIEPAPSITWDLAATLRRPSSRLDPDFTRFIVSNSVDENAVNRLGLAALRDCVPRGDWVYALDWQHPSYRFWPHRAGPIDGWPVTVYPDGDYYLFLAPDLSFGTLGHPWEKTLCVFGQALIDAVYRRNRNTLTTILRRSTPTTTIVSE